MNMKRISAVAAWGVLVLMLTAGSGFAASFMGGNDLIDRTTRDGANAITFIDLTHRITTDGWLTSWSFYADYTVSSANSHPKQVALKIFRENGSNYDLVGQSSLVTVNEWDKIYIFSLPSIAVQENDIIGWYYPVQGWPGGVISYQSGTGTDTRWTGWPDPLGEITGTVPQSRFAYGGEGRLYSISVAGTPVPVPATLLLLGSGLAGLAATRRRRQK